MADYRGLTLGGSGYGWGDQDWSQYIKQLGGMRPPGGVLGSLGPSYQVPDMQTKPFQMPSGMGMPSQAPSVYSGPLGTSLPPGMDIKQMDPVRLPNLPPVVSNPTTTSTPPWTMWDGSAPIDPGPVTPAAPNPFPLGSPQNPMFPIGPQAIPASNGGGGAMGYTGPTVSTGLGIQNNAPGTNNYGQNPTNFMQQNGYTKEDIGANPALAWKMWYG